MNKNFVALYIFLMFSYILRQNRRILRHTEFYIYRPTVFYLI